MFKFGEPIKPREPVRVAKAEQPWDYDDLPEYDEESLKEHFLEIFRKRKEESED